jgi:8-oxo-dGTP pyrophosphatase MutT (NUDIX family)
VPGSRSKAERSAGVIVYRQRLNQPREYLLLDYGRYWDFPKGHVEAGEDDLTAAVRELKEEAGIAADQVELADNFVKEITYFFRSKGALIRKSVAFFAAQTQVDDSAVAISHEHVGFAFLPYEQALARLKYPTAKEVLETAEQFLSQA